MAQPLDVEHLLATGKQFTDRGRSQARQVGSELASQGRLATEQIAALIDHLASRGTRERIDELRQTVRDEMHHELRTLRESMTEDLAKIEAGVDRIHAVLNDVRSESRERDEELREKVRDEVQHELWMLRASLDEDLTRVEAGVDRIGTALNEVRRERRERDEELRESVRDEVQHQLSVLGLATREDVSALGRTLRDDLRALVTRFEHQVGSTTGSEDDVRQPAPATARYENPPTT